MVNSALIKSSLVKKYWMAATGLFLCLFLVGHLAGNLQLLLPPEKALLQFNEYAKFMTTFPLVKVLSYLTYFSILFHSVDGVILLLKNRKARPVKYAYTKPSKNSKWSSRNMGLLGSILLLFLIIHMRSFWYEMHFGEVPLDSNNNKDLYTITLNAFQSVWYVIFYLFSMLAVALHLSHGFGSAFQSVGVSHPRLKILIKPLTYFFCIVVPLAFALIPISLYFR